MRHTLTLVFALLMLLDGWTTYHVLKAGGWELNKPLAWLMEKIGVVPALLNNWQVLQRQKGKT